METSKSENKNVAEIHGCLVCARPLNVLAVYTPDGKLVNCTATSPGGHIVPDEHQPLVACNTHSPKAVEIAYKRWQSLHGQKPIHEQEEQ